MPGPAPKASRRRANTPARGEWQPSPGFGWQHGAIPDAPDGLVAASRTAWETWFRAWWASNWTLDDLPGLRIVVAQYDAVERANPAKANDITALVRLMDTYGITPAGQQARRWARPDVPEEEATPPIGESRYGHLRVAG